jgi:hypothetical protein
VQSPLRSVLSDRQALPAVLLGLAAPFLLVLRPNFLDFGAALFFIVTIWIGLAACVDYLRYRPQPPMPLMPLTAIFYIIFFALPAFFIDRDWWSTGHTAGDTGSDFGVHFDKVTTQTGALVCLGLLCQLLAYYGVSTRRVVKKLPSVALPKQYSVGRFKAVLWLLAAGHVVFLYTRSTSSLFSVAQAATPIGFFVIGMLFVLWQRGALRDTEKVFYWAVFMPLEFIIHLYDGLITPIILLFIFLLTIHWYLNRKIGFLVLVAVLAAVYVFPVLKLSNFFIAGNSMSIQTHLADKADAFGIAASLFWNGRRPKETNPAVEAIAQKNVVAPILRRISLVVLLQYCSDITPDPIPYLGGTTFANLATNVVPRLLWKDKPPEMLGQWFGHKYRILNSDDNITSINLPWIVEFYVNFGPAGVLIGMAVVGVVLALLEQVFMRPGMMDVEVIAGWALLFRIFYQESNISLMLGGLISQMVFLYLLLFVVLRFFCRGVTGP